MDWNLNSLIDIERTATNMYEHIRIFLNALAEKASGVLWPSLGWWVDIIRGKWQLGGSICGWDYSSCAGVVCGLVGKFIVTDHLLQWRGSSGTLLVALS